MSLNRRLTVAPGHPKFVEALISRKAQDLKINAVGSQANRKGMQFPKRSQISSPTSPQIPPQFWNGLCLSIRAIPGPFLGSLLHLILSQGRREMRRREKSRERERERHREREREKARGQEATPRLKTTHGNREGHPLPTLNRSSSSLVSGLFPGLRCGQILLGPVPASDSPSGLTPMHLFFSFFLSNKFFFESVATLRNCSEADTDRNRCPAARLIEYTGNRNT